MIIEKLSQKYKCGCGRGLNKLDVPGLLAKLNVIIEWPLSKLPEGDTEKELKPGDCWMEVGQAQIMAIDGPDRLVLIVSESGPLALDRIWSERIRPELDLMFGSLQPDTEISWQVHSGSVPAECSEQYTPPYAFYRVWRDKFVVGRGFLENFVIEVTYAADSFMFQEMKLYFTPWNVWFDPSQVPTEAVEMIVRDILEWFYSETDRILPPTPEPEMEEPVK